MNEIIPGSFLETGKDPTIVFEFIEKTLHEMSLFIDI